MSNYFDQFDWPTMMSLNPLPTDCARAYDIKKYHKILSPDYPDFLGKYIALPVLQRLRGVGLLCGTDWTKLYRNEVVTVEVLPAVGCTVGVGTPDLVDEVRLRSEGLVGARGQVGRQADVAPAVAGGKSLVTIVEAVVDVVLHGGTSDIALGGDVGHVDKTDLKSFVFNGFLDRVAGGQAKCCRKSEK